MAEIVKMPKLSDTMTEGVVAEWHKKVGDPVESGELLAEIETDKATMEFDSFQDGVLLHIGVQTGETAPVDSILAILGEKGEDITELLKSDPAPAEETPAPKAEVSAPATAPVASAPVAQMTHSDNSRVKASPLAKKMANDKGIDLGAVAGSGDGGRVVKRDIENHSGSSAPVASRSAAGVESYTEENVSQMRKVIAKRLAESKFTAPHFYLTMDIDMDNAMAARASLKAKNIKVSFNDMVIKATAVSLKKHPKINSSWLEDKIRYNEHVHIGVAVAVDEGLLVPVVRHADTKLMSDINAEVFDYATRAREKKLQPHEWEGNTFTISNLGMFGIEEFTAIVNPPDACILAVGGIRTEPVVKNGQIVIGNRMKVTLSCDHRVVDGATGSEFLQTLKGMLENPIMMIA
ncbi:MAG: pyruvate dehydrogenase E2 component (dihydrolipoamide acetyltransferase) [Saprospiraceae bacterium]|jgi:pyruvate dehydrogenase E2 component (dihydrolipoamide acetyltransferase)